MLEHKIPKVSIITCFLNADQYLEESINSVLEQEYDNWELLLIDDGSTDNSTSIAREYVSLYPNKIFYYDHEGHVNKGLSASRNRGISASSGEFISFLDADDVWCPKLLLELLTLIQQHKVSMICEATKYWYSWNNAEKSDIIIEIGTKQNQYYNPPQLMLNLYPLGRGAAPCVCGIIVKKDVLVKYGGFNEAFTGMYEDQVFLSKFYLNESVFISSTCNNLYRQRSDSLVGSSSFNNKYHEARRKYLDWLTTYLKDENICYPEVFALLRYANLPYKYPLLDFLINSRIYKSLKRLKKCLIKNRQFWQK